MASRSPPAVAPDRPTTTCSRWVSRSARQAPARRVSVGQHLPPIPLREQHCHQGLGENRISGYRPAARYPPSINTWQGTARNWRPPPIGFRRRTVNSAYSFRVAGNAEPHSPGSRGFEAPEEGIDRRLAFDTRSDPVDQREAEIASALRFRAKTEGEHAARRRGLSRCRRAWRSASPRGHPPQAPTRTAVAQVGRQFIW